MTGGRGLRLKMATPIATILVTVLIGSAGLWPIGSAAAATSTTPESQAIASHVTFTDPSTVNDFFGGSTAMATGTAVVGAPADDGSGVPGAAHLYVKTSSGWPASPTVTLKDPNATVGDRFGHALAISGNTLVVGAPGTNSWTGVVYVYVKTRLGWPTVPTATLADPGLSQSDYFGWSVAISGTTVMVGAYGAESFSGNVYLYRRSNGIWSSTPTDVLNDPRTTANDGFGFSMAASGPTLIVGSSGTSASGRVASIYVEGSTGWPTAPTVTLQDPTSNSHDYFGYAVVVSGGAALVGSPLVTSPGSAYLYVRESAGWPTAPTVVLSDPVNQNSDAYAESVALSGKVATVGVRGANSDAGLVETYLLSPTGWPASPTETLTDPAASADDEFGRSVAVVGRTIIAGAPFATTAYLFGV